MTEEQEQPQDGTQPDVSQFCPKGDVLVVAEHILGELQPVTMELLGAGRLLADKMDRQLKCVSDWLQTWRHSAKADRTWCRHSLCRR